MIREGSGGSRMVYEVREWFGGERCLYTDDRRVKDLAVQAPNLRVTSSYFRGGNAREPYAWDITGPNEAIAPVVESFSHGSRSRR
jgi:hypothetical protein